VTARRLTWLVAAVLATATAMTLASLALAVLNRFENPWDFGTAASSLLLFVPEAAFLLVGGLLALRHRGNAFGWICLGCGLAMAFAGAMIRRLRQASGVERQQLKWFAFAAAVLAIGFFPVVMLDVWFDRRPARRPSRWGCCSPRTP